MEKLTDYISMSGETRAKFAQECGISAPYLSQIISGIKRPSLGVALKIERITNGAVPVSVWAENKGAAA